MPCSASTIPWSSACTSSGIDGTIVLSESGRFSVSVLDGAKTGSGDEISAVAGGDSPAAPWADPSGDSLGLALLGAVVQDLDVDENGEGGTRVTMSWPVA